MVQICIRILLIPFEWLEFVLECFETLSNGSNLHLNALNPFRMARICIRMPPITFECFESHSNGSNLYSNASNPIRMIRISIRMLQSISNG